jgi:predicted GIY-YIG superfamily endonuclease
VARVTAIVGCYLLHFDGRVFGKQHYLGWALDIDRRLRIHLRGKGARLVRQALEAGLSVELVRIWPNADRHAEYVLKRRAPKSYCPRCHPRSGGENGALGEPGNPVNCRRP